MTESYEINDIRMVIGANIKKIFEKYKKEGKVQNQTEFHKLVDPQSTIDDATRKNYVSDWCKGKGITLDTVALISKATGIPYREIVDDKEIDIPVQKIRTLQDWCKILFVDMPKAFSVSWDDERIINNDDLPAPYAYLDIHIRLDTEPFIDYNTGYPSGHWGYESHSKKMLTCAKKVKSIMSCYGLSDKQKEEACVDAIGETSCFWFSTY